MKNRRGSSRPAAKGLTTSWLLATALPVCLGLVPLQAEATADEVGGNGTIADQFVTSNVVWTGLRSELVINPDNAFRWCIATCSADALNPVPVGTHQYRFRVSLNGAPAAVNSPYERTLQFLNQLVFVPAVPPLFVPVRDNSTKEITTTGGAFLTPPGQNSIKCEAMKFLAATPDLTVDDASLTVACTDTRLP